MVGESEVSVVLTLTKAVNELIQLNLHLYFYEQNEVVDSGRKVLYQRFCFDFGHEDDFDVVVSVFGNQIQFIDFIDMTSEDSDTITLYSCVLQEKLSEDEAVKLITEKFFVALECYYENKKEAARNS